MSKDEYTADVVLSTMIARYGISFSFT